jgi:hypothetical protein
MGRRSKALLVRRCEDDVAGSTFGQRADDFVRILRVTAQRLPAIRVGNNNSFETAKPSAVPVDPRRAIDINHGGNT